MNIEEFCRQHGEASSKRYEAFLSGAIESPIDNQGLTCPHCDRTNSFKVLWTREDINSIRRRRECLHCHNRVTTYESVLPIDVEAKLKRLERLESFFLRISDAVDKFDSD